MNFDFKEMLPDAFKRLYEKKHGHITEEESKLIAEFVKDKFTFDDPDNSEYQPDDEILKIQELEHLEQLSHRVYLVITNLVNLFDCDYQKGIDEYSDKAISNHKEITALSQDIDYGLFSTMAINDFHDFCCNYQLPVSIENYIKKPSINKLQQIISKKQKA